MTETAFFDDGFYNDYSNKTSWCWRGNFFTKNGKIYPFARTLPERWVKICGFILLCFVLIIYRQSLSRIMFFFCLPVFFSVASLALKQSHAVLYQWPSRIWKWIWQNIKKRVYKRWVRYTCGTVDKQSDRGGQGYCDAWPLLLTWFNFKLSMDK